MASAPRIRIDPDCPIPAVRQISDQLRVFLVEGALPPGTALPSVRRLSMELGVHFNTVAEAYRRLAEEGWLDLKHGRGAVAAHRPKSLAGRERLAEFRSRLRQLAAEMRSNGMSNSKVAAELRALADSLT